MKKIIVTSIFILSFAQGGQAQILAPATSDDLNEFDQQLSQVQTAPLATPKTPGKKSHEGRFGSLVSEEARKLKDSDKKPRNEMGQWVSEQKRKSDEKAPSAIQSRGGGNANSANKDARSSSPASKDRGNSSGAPGNHKK